MISEYEELQKEMALQKEQQAVNLKDYGKKVIVLDKEVTGLEKVKKALLSDIKALGKDKDSKANTLLTEAKKINEEARAGRQVVAEKDKDLDISIKELDKMVEKAKKEREKEVKENNERSSSLGEQAQDIKRKQKVVDLNLKEAQDELWKAREYSKEVESLKGELAKATMEARAKKSKNESKGKELEARMLENKRLNIELDNLVKEAKENKDYINNSLMAFNEQKDIAMVELNKRESDYVKKLSDMVEQVNVNKLRALEIDAGFEELNTKKREVAVATKKLKEIKEQLLK